MLIFHFLSSKTRFKAGMAGAICCGDYWDDPQPNWSAFRYSGDFGFTQLDIFNETALHFQFIRNWDGNVYDDFWLVTNHNFS